MNAVSEPARFLIDVDQYHRMGEAGIIPPDARTELIEGEVLLMPPMGLRHASTLATLNDLFTEPHIRPHAFVWAQLPVVISRFSEPLPDVVLLRRRPSMYRDRAPRPEDVLLLVEVSDTSLTFDRRRKIPLYVRHGVREAWIVNVKDRCLEVFRNPTETGYATSFIKQPHETLAPIELPDFQIAWGATL